MSSPVVLVVDDEPDIVDLLRLDLTLAGDTVRSAADGRTGRVARAQLVARLT